MTEHTFRPTRYDAAYLALIVLAVVIWFHPFFLQGEYLIPPNANSIYPWYGTDAYTAPHPQGSMDAVRESYPIWALTHEYQRAGIPPTWNPHILSGNAMLANQFAIPYSPLKLLNFFLSAPAAWSWAIVLKSLLSGMGLYLAVRALGLSPPAATVGALAWMLNWPLAHQTQTTYSEGLALTPLLLFVLIYAWQAHDWRRMGAYTALGALLAGWQFLAGNVQMTIYACLFLGAFALIYAWARSLRPWRPFMTVVAVYGLGVFVGAVQLATSYELFTFSMRGVGHTHLNRGILPYTEISLLNPWIYFWQNFEFPSLRDAYWLNDRWNPYIGLLPLLLVGVAARFVRDRLALGILVATLAAVGVLHLLYPSIIAEPLNEIIPGYNVLDHERILLILPLPLAVLAAYGADWLLANGCTCWPALRRLLMIAALVVPLMLAGLLALTAFFAAEEAAAPTGDTFSDQRTRVGLGLLADYYNITNPLFVVSLGFAVGALGLVWAYGRGRLARRGFVGGMLLVAGADLLLMASVNIATTPPDKLYPATDATRFLQTRMAQEGPFRITAAPNTLNQGRESGPYAAYRDDHGWFMSSSQPVLPPNAATLYGLHDARGYESVFTLWYAEYLALADDRPTPFGANVWPSNVARAPLMDVLNVRYVLAIEPLSDPLLELVYDDEILIYENRAALPRVRLHDTLIPLPDDDAVLAALSAPGYDPREVVYMTDETAPPGVVLESVDGAEARLIDYAPHRVVVGVATSGAALLLLADGYHPGWRAEIDGQPAEVLRANHTLRAVILPPGAEQVVFTFASPLYETTLWISMLSGGALGLGALVLGGLGYRKRDRLV